MLGTNVAMIVGLSFHGKTENYLLQILSCLIAQQTHKNTDQLPVINIQKIFKQSPHFTYYKHSLIKNDDQIMKNSFQLKWSHTLNVQNIL